MSAPRLARFSTALLPAAARPRTAVAAATWPQTTSLALPNPGLRQHRYKSGLYGYIQTKALVYSKLGEPSDVLKLHTHSISPSIPSHAAVLRTLAAPINPADVNTIQGTYGVKPTFSSLIGTAEPSSVPGNEGCFEVLSVGSAVKSLSKGDWVIPASTGLGTWRTHALVDNADAALFRVAGPHGTAIPDKTDQGPCLRPLTPVQAATVSVNPSSAYRMLRDYVDLLDLSVKSYASGSADGGAWFIQNGANSGVGRAAIQLGKLWGLRSINVVRARAEEGGGGGAAATEALKDELRELGATVVVTEDEFLDRSFVTRLNDEWTHGSDGSLMLGLNCVGGKSAQQIARVLSPGGTMVTYGAMSKQPVSLPTGLLIFKDIRFRGFWLSRWADGDRAAKKKTVDELLGLMRAGKLRDAPVDEVPWRWETGEEPLKEAVQGTLAGFRKGKSVFAFGDT